MVKRFFVCFATVLLLFFSSCYYHEVKTTLNPELGSFQPTTPESVVVYDEGFTPSWDFIIIAKLTVDSSTVDWANALAGKSQQPIEVPRSAVYKKVKAEAAKLGADAVIITNKEIDIHKFNEVSRTYGSAFAWRNRIYASSTTYTTVDRIRHDIRHIYAVKKSEPRDESFH